MMAAYCFLAVFYWHRGPCGRRTNINTKDKSLPTLFPLIRCDVEQDGEGLVEAAGGSGGSLMALWSAASDGGKAIWVVRWNFKDGCERKCKMCQNVSFISTQCVFESGLREGR